MPCLIESDPETSPAGAVEPATIEPPTGCVIAELAELAPGDGAPDDRAARELVCSVPEGDADDEFDEDDFDDDFDDDFEDELDDELNDDLDEFDEDIEQEGDVDPDADDEDAAFGEDEF